MKVKTINQEKWYERQFNYCWGGPGKFCVVILIGLVIVGIKEQITTMRSNDECEHCKNSSHEIKVFDQYRTGGACHCPHEQKSVDK